ncbi:HNH endonuclease [Nocardioides sp. NBC_00850]|uniref:HNH endonuclease n=1 Tax=Nocardioides sp. NBC_00850 TaxID=2976001 RepID=UPI00386FAC74|nr:HNH endonuclease [Nocardioides sp. NBC_00850]
MVDVPNVSAWLLMAVGDDRQHGGNSGYDDQADVYYTWDSTVPNHARIKIGDPVALWDKHRLLGLSVIEAIDTEVKEKLRYKCPSCGRSGIKARKTKSPRYKCSQCGHEFDLPTSETITVTEYRSRHDAAWTSLDNLLPRDQLRKLCASPDSQLSMRELRWDAFQDALSARGAERAVDRVAHRTPDLFFPQGHLLEIVRVRRGQRRFREHLLDSMGEVCAFTGDAPAKVLEAGHLYSYAKLGVHHEHGGLMLRRDVHRLFDDGSLAVNPSSLSIDVSDQLEAYPQYAALHDQQLRVQPHDQQVEWLARHWAEHRAS